MASELYTAIVAALRQMFSLDGYHHLLPDSAVYPTGGNPIALS
jgi:hypothetical protein